MQLDVVRSGGMEDAAKSLKGAPRATRGARRNRFPESVCFNAMETLRNDHDGRLVLGGRCSLLHPQPGLVRSRWEAGQWVLAEVDHPTLVVGGQQIGFPFAELLSVPEELHEGLRCSVDCGRPH